jgi:hypothetical protein
MFAAGRMPKTVAFNQDNDRRRKPAARIGQLFFRSWIQDRDCVMSCWRPCNLKRFLLVVLTKASSGKTLGKNFRINSAFHVRWQAACT